MKTFFTGLDVQAVFSSLVTGWPIAVNFDGPRREVTVNGIKRINPCVIEVTGCLDCRDIVMQVNVNKHSPDYGSGSWRYYDENNKSSNTSGRD